MSKGLETKEMILSTALGMIRQSGLDSLTIGEVGKRTKMSKSGIFTHFSSREELLLNLVDYSNNEFKHQVFDRAILAKAGLARIRALSDLWLQWDDHASGGCPFLSAAFEFDDRPGVVRDAIVRSQKLAIDIWEKSASMAIREKEFKADADCSQFAYEVFGNIMVYNMFKRLLKNPKSIHRYKENFELIINKCKK